jgi:hypothetical protein
VFQCWINSRRAGCFDISATASANAFRLWLAKSFLSLACSSLVIAVSIGAILKLVKNWREVTLYSWSFYLNVALALLSALESAQTYIVDGKLSSALIVCLISASAAIARLIKQVTVSGEEPKEIVPLGI